MAAQCVLAAVADDFTGGSDLAGMLFEQGVATVQIFGLPAPELISALAGRSPAVVLSLKSRSIAAAQARALSLAALDRLRPLAPRQVQFKYCSTFDSTAEGNIGPVIDALLAALDAPFTIAVPALPVNGRTQYLGHLFVGGQPLSESPLRHHPLNPMDDSNLVRFLAKQTTRRVGLIDLAAVRSGEQAIREAIARQRAAGVEIALVDAVAGEDLARIAEATWDLPLITGGSGLAMHLPAVWRARAVLADGEPAPLAAPLPRPRRTLILSGSCSAATLEQVARLEASGCEVLALPAAEGITAALWDGVCASLRSDGLAAVASSAPAGQRDPAPGAAARIERLFAEIARRAVAEQDVRQLIVAGGETAGAVVEALRLPAVALTGIVAPGVPSLATIGGPPLGLVLKSGNFGQPDFFRRAVTHLEQR